MPTSKSSTNTTKVKPTLEIIPDTRFIVFSGDEHEASKVTLTGRVRLRCADATSISKPKIRLEGKRKVSWVFLGNVTSGVAEEKRVFLNEERPLGSIESTHKVNAGTIEWPFEFELLPSMPESVEGLRDTYIIYHLHASVSRPGWNQRDITAASHLRLVRTLGSQAVETTRSRTNADIWANKLSYSISIPSDAVIFGTSITADVELSPIRKGIKLGRVEMKLMETVVKRIIHPDIPESRHERAKSEEVEVAKYQMDFPETAKITYEDESADEPVMADEMYRFQATLPLPKSLHRCRQDVDTHQINITHRFKLMVNIHNPEGHISQLVCRLPVKIFISPNLPINDSNEVLLHAGAQAVLDSMAVTAPPQYGQHQLDQIFSDIDPAGYISRAGTGPSSPTGFLAQSRRGSDENLQSMDGVASNGSTAAIHGSALPAALHLRLRDLQESNVPDVDGVQIPTASAYSSGHATPAGIRTHQGSPADGQRSFAASRNRSSVHFAVSSSSPNGSAGASRRPSAEEQQQQQQQQQQQDLSVLPSYMTDLSRVPSYNAAIRTPIPATSYEDHPPSYVDATSRPPSPRSLSDSHPHGNTSPSATARLPESLSIGGGHADEEARLRTLRAQN